MKQKKKLRAALIGFGGMGHFHAGCYKDQKHVELVAVCDIDKSRFDDENARINLGNSGGVDLRGCKLCYSWEELCRTVEFDMLDICLPCHLHAEYAVKAMKKGYHVLCEKPMARNLSQADRMIRTAAETGRSLMIAQCLRFASEYQYLKELINSGKYGRLLRMDMRRNSDLPDRVWYHDAAKSGGALLDLHLHDTDFIHWTLGVPETVQTFGISRESGGIDDLMTSYGYTGGPVVNAEASWCRGGWSCSCSAVFAEATVELAAKKISIFHRDGRLAEEIRFEDDPNGYFNEIAYFSESVVNGTALTACSAESTRESIRIALAEERSALKGGRKTFLKK